AMLQVMLEGIKRETVKILCHVQIRTEEDARALEQPSEPQGEMQIQHEEADSQAAAAGDDAAVAEAVQAPAKPNVRTQRKVGRNKPCPCGSGKKYKHCHGQLE